MVVEAYPALYKRRYPNDGRHVDEHDAWSIAAWLQGMDRRNALERDFMPPLSRGERDRAAVEGWIIGAG